jgi:hypothetical protein
MNDEELALVSRSTMRDVLLILRQAEGSLPDHVPDLVPGRAQPSSSSTSAPISDDLGHLFGDLPLPLPRFVTTHFVSLPFSDLAKGNIVGQFVLNGLEVVDVVLFQVTQEVPRLLRSLRDNSVSGSLSPARQVWATTASGLQQLRPLTGSAPIQPPVASRAPVTDLTRPSALELLRTFPPSAMDLLNRATMIPSMAVPSASAGSQLTGFSLPSPCS